MGKRLKGLFFLLFAGWVCAGAVGAVSVTDAPSYLLPLTSDTSDASSSGEIVSAIPFVGQLQALPASRVVTSSFYRADPPQKEPVSPRFPVSLQTDTLLRLKIFGLSWAAYEAVAAACDSGEAFYRLCRLQI